MLTVFPVECEQTQRRACLSSTGAGFGGGASIFGGSASVFGGGASVFGGMNCDITNPPAPAPITALIIQATADCTLGDMVVLPRDVLTYWQSKERRVIRKSERVAV